MRILLVNHLLDPVSGGGTAERTYQLARFMTRAGADCTILTLDIGLTPERRDSLGFARLVAMPCVNRRYFVPWLSMDRVRRLIATADVVLLSGHWTLLNAMAFRACRQLGRPYLFSPAGALTPFGRSFWLKRWYQRMVGRRLVQSAMACIAVTEDERADFLGSGVPAEQVTVIPNGIDPEDYRRGGDAAGVAEFREMSGVGDHRYVLFLGRLNSIKGPDLLLAAFASLGPEFVDLHLVLAGPDGGMLAQLQAEVASRGLAGRVHFIGYLGGQGKVSALSAASLLVIPSRREAMSIVVLEGGVCGCPVLFTDVCGLDELARENAGVMVPVSAEALAAAIGRMLRDPIASQSNAERLAGIVRARYSWAVQAERHLALAHWAASNARNDRPVYSSSSMPGRNAGDQR